MKKLALVLTVVASLLGSARSEVPDLDLSPSEIQQIQGEVQQLERLLPKAVDRAEVTYILAADNSRRGVREVIAVEAERNYVVLHQRAGAHIMRESISRMAERLEPYGFVRIHRSVVVNASYVEEIRRWPSGEYIVKVPGDREYTVTRTVRRNLKSMAHS